MVGILTEKPSAGRNFASALGGAQGTYNGEQFVIVAARGHLYEYVSPERQVDADLVDKYKSWNLENLPWNENDFAWKREKKKDTAQTLNTIKTVLSQCDEIVIATDVDPTGEGELLAWEILAELNLRPQKYSRMFFVDEVPKSLQKAFTTRKPIASMESDMDYVKALYRSKWDYMSMQWTRIATKCGDGQSVLRQGRLKSAMVLLTGDALEAVKNYKKIPFYQNRFKDENGNVFVKKDEPTFPDKSQVPNFYTDSAVVIDSKEMKSSAPPRLLDLSGLSSRLSSSGIKAKDVLAVYQKMYEAKIVSYPRTEDKVITPEQFNELLPLIDKIAGVVGVDTSLLTHRTPRSTHVKTGGAHGANRPGINVPNSLNDLKVYGSCAPMIYEILAKNYLAILAEDYEYESQKGHLEKYPDFLGSASVPKKMGYKAVFNDADDDDADDSSAGLGTNASPFVYEGFPPKPPTPSMKWLMKQLEKHDVGTGATRTSIYADVTNEKTSYPLLIEKKGKLSMSDYGNMSYLLLKDTHIGNLQITEQLMADMRLIADGKANPDECLHRVQQLIVEDIKTMQANSVTMRSTLSITPKQIVQKEKYEGVWNGIAVRFNREFGGYRFTDSECEQLCAGETIKIRDLVGKSGNTYGIKGRLEEQVYNGQKYIGFKNLGFIDDEVPKIWCQHEFTPDEIAKLENGETIQLDGCISSKGNIFKAKVRWGDREDGTKGIIPEFDKSSKSKTSGGSKRRPTKRK